MAAIYNPGILGVKSPQQCGCQELLSKSNVAHHGWLRKRSFRNRIQNKISVQLLRWPQVYVIVAENCLYYFRSEVSSKPAGAVSLYGYNRVVRAGEVKATDNPWAFKLEHIQPSVKSFYFAAPSEREMRVWMQVCKSEMLAANSMGSRTTGNVGQSLPADEMSWASSSSWGSADYRDLESCIYVEPVGCRISVVCDDADDPSSIEEDDIEEVAPALPKRPASVQRGVSAEEYSLQTSLPGYSQAGNGKTNYWESVFFNGNKARAAQIINTIDEPGVYLVRKSEDGSDVLVLRTSTGPHKYRIYPKENGEVTLSLTTGPTFSCLEELLYHYYDNTLPNTNQKLTVPYKLHSDYRG